MKLSLSGQNVCFYECVCFRPSQVFILGIMLLFYYQIYSLLSVYRLTYHDNMVAT